jgi:acyl-CoA thioesterase-1
MFQIKRNETTRPMNFNTIRFFQALGLSACLLVACSEIPQTATESKSASTAAEQADAATDSSKVVLIFGNSLTAGYGVEAAESFPALIQGRMDSLGLPYEVINAGVSGETTATGLNRIDWVIEKQDIDIFILELGANDGLRGLPPKQTRQNLEAMIDRVRAVHPKAEIILAGMMVPPSMGPAYSDAYNRIYPDIAKAKNVALIPFLLENVGGIASLNQADGIHPNPAGNKVVLENVWAVLGGLVER